MADESRYVCKLCNKRFPCGKSFGGHMRSHVVANSAEIEENLECFDMKRDQFVSDSGYILRENPKKSWRAVRPPLQEEKVCKQCGKGFKSMKALCGHMACHSERERGGASAKDDQYSWTSENQKVVLDSHSDTETEERMVRIRTRSASKSRKCKKIAEDWPFVLGNNGSSSVSEIDGHEQEEMAVCLMMLSRDCGVKVGVNSVVESSENNSVVVETKSSSMEVRKERVERYEEGKFGDGETAKMEDSDSGYFLDECAKGESEVSVDCNRRSGGFGVWKKSSQINSCANELRKSRKGNAYDDDEDEIVVDDDEKCGGVESRKRKYGSGFWNESARMVKSGDKKSKYECFNCKKTFKSYQALGGHRPCSKRTNAYGECGENSPDDSAYYKSSTAKFVESPSKRKESSAKSPSEKKIKTKKNNSNNNKPHACPFCDRVFKNGQALGGHKRSHFLTGHDESSSRSLVEKPDDDIRDLLDLNLPAPEADEDEDGGHFLPW
ncbi:hypothetical protein SASPL_107824 [Salvia splendens]|uniref:C2H2-type domain-containing protein n=1 Tax=Salvia splendens TaxID=180675 RepID=A0A8X8YBW0_SALSN|nr:zinc finger protein ZAT4-like [Salvia splendens]KAG6429771.1 hypothetical protein SASPL_107824 [Salvia splendens]